MSNTVHVWSNLHMSVHDTQRLNAQPRLCTQREPSTLVLLHVFVNIFDVKQNKRRSIVLLSVCKHFPVVTVFLGYWANILTPYKGRKNWQKKARN